MASLTREDNIDWFWGSLKPWQILHSTLAERERIGSPLDVWELVTETLGANTANSIREDATAVQDEDVDKGWAHRMKFLGDDGEFWRHGGVMESRVRDWLIRSHEEQELANHSFLPLSSAHHLHRHHHDQPNIVLHNYFTSSELAIAYSSIAPVPQCYDSSTISQLVAAGRVMSDDEDQSSEETEAGENAGVGVDEDDVDDQDLHLATVEEEDYRDNYALISTNYDDDHDGYTGFSTVGECRLVVNRCCGAAAIYNDHDNLQVSATARSAAGPYLEEEMPVQEEIEVCAVCLEKLNNDEEEEAVQALACRHLFHRDCIAPWLERQPHACCPCCRAPILAPPQLHLAAPLNVAATPQSSCSGNHHHHHAAARQRDIMGLLADMEAALERLGFRS